MTTADLLGFASLAVAGLALLVSLAAIRRDRAYLIVSEKDAAAGQRYLYVVNVGLRPVRITKVVLRRHRWARWERSTDLTAWSSVRGADDHDLELPFVLAPADEVLLQVANPAMLDLPDADGRYAVGDASGRLHWPPFRGTSRHQPPGEPQVW